MAEAIRLRRVSEINACNAELISYEPLGKNWVSRFVKRRPQLGTTRGRAIESSRIKETTAEKLRQWFDEFKRFVDEHNVDPKNQGWQSSVRNSTSAEQTTEIFRCRLVSSWS